MSDLSAALVELAAAHGVMTGYEDWAGRPVDVSAQAVVSALAALDVDASSDRAIEASIRDARLARWRTPVPATSIVRAGRRVVDLHLPAGVDASAQIELADGDRRALAVGEAAEQRDVDGATVERRAVDVPTDIGHGYHRLAVTWPGGAAAGHLIDVPERCPDARELGRTWGLMVQLYAVRSRSSWGIGDYADLASLARWAGAVGADHVLVNPLHAAGPVLPQVDSPYSPASRRFHSTLHLRVDAVPEAEQLAGDEAKRLDDLAAAGRRLSGSDRIDRDAVARIQRDALELVRSVPLPPERAAALEAYRQREGAGLRDFATWCALAEEHGPVWSRWPPELQHPHRGGAVAAEAERLADRVAWHEWLQWLCDEQLAAAQAAAVDAGQRVGVIHDLAVGVDPDGADGWAHQDDLALSMSVGAPPDSFNQRGQDWQLPPLRPDRLAASGYAVFREVIGSALRHGGGLRIDHAMGLFRLYWVPAGGSPRDGTYVRYPADDLLGILALEAHRAGAVVIAEDLGTVEAGVPEALAAHGVLGSSVLWFERDESGGFRRAGDYRADSYASVTTHDLPTARGFWRGTATELRAELGLLGRSRDEQESDDAAERSALRTRLVADGLVDADADEDALVVAMHTLLARTPSRLVGVALGDAVGDARQPNLPGTRDDYPCWRLPLVDPTGRPVLVEDLAGHPGAEVIVTALRDERPRRDG